MTTPLNPQRPQERELGSLKATVAQLPWSLVVTSGRRHRCRMPPGDCGAAARSIAVRVLPVATRLATATTGTTSPTAMMMVMMIRFVICSRAFESSESMFGYYEERCTRCLLGDG